MNKVWAWVKKYWKALTLIGLSVILLIAYWQHQRSAANAKRASDGVAALDEAKTESAEEAAAHREKAEGHEKLAQAAINEMKATSRKLKENGNENLARFVDAWY